MPEEQSLESDSPALSPTERTLALEQQLEQWQQLLQKLDVNPVPQAE